MMKAGQYYIGDLCYVLNDDAWFELCDLTIQKNSALDGEFENPKGIKFAIYGTKYGDGTYQDEDGRNYPVDSGTIGCIATEYMTDTPAGAVIVTFAEDFETGSENGVIWFGDKVRIDTDPPYEEEYDEIEDSWLDSSYEEQ